MGCVLTHSNTLAVELYIASSCDAAGCQQAPLVTPTPQHLSVVDLHLDPRLGTGGAGGADKRYRSDTVRGALLVQLLQ